WIELLKHSYYEDFDDGTYHNLKTLPNIDINIKCGNSLLSKMPINESLHLQTQQDIKKYKKLEEQYYDGLYENRKEHIEDINTIKNNFIKFYIREKYKKELNKLYEKYEEYAKNYGKFALDELPLKYEDMKTRIKAQLLSMFSSTDIDKVKAKEELEFLKKSYDEIYSGFEWRVEFSKILYSSLSQEEITQNNQSKQQGNFKNLHKDKEGDFKGFDLVIGNPPYIRQEEIKELKPHLAKHYEIYKGT
ncbi:Eco57I restriction-modification methylase domain-containing protein, partial [Campylobacter sp. VTCC 70190]|uniref:Eco57I restriction-modification methylase domain-containing protein n=1 Tax=Campylobacter sp. VTCC 70190 TaxID=3392118 RepID=UPI00398E8BA0